MPRLHPQKTHYTEQVARVVRLLQGKWTLQILCAMRVGPVRLSELRREIPSASNKALTKSLRSLEAAHIVLRKDLSKTVLHVEYEVAGSMLEPLVSLLDHLAIWGKLYGSGGAPLQTDTVTEPDQVDMPSPPSIVRNLMPETNHRERNKTPKKQF
jgi:DNA-binding HxlR family transcriptional regulator